MKIYEDGQNPIERMSHAITAENHSMHLDAPESTSGEGCFFADIRNIKNESLMNSEVVCTPMSDSSEDDLIEDTTEDKEVESGCTKLSSSPTESLILSTIFLLFYRRRR